MNTQTTKQVNREAPSVQLSVQGGVAVAVLSSPKQGNPLSLKTMDELRAVLKAVATNDSVGVFALRAEGRHFCVGADLEWIGALASGDGELWSKGVHSLFELLRDLYEFPKPMVGAVQGTVVGGGVALLCLFDEVITVSGARWSLPEVKLGMVPTVVLPALYQRVNRASLNSLLYGDGTWSACEVVNFGLATKCVDMDDLEKIVGERLEHWLEIPTTVYSTTKRLQQQMDGIDFERQLDLAMSEALKTIDSKDARVRVQKFISK